MHGGVEKPGEEQPPVMGQAVRYLNTVKPEFYDHLPFVARINGTSVGFSFEVIRNFKDHLLIWTKITGTKGWSKNTGSAVQSLMTGGP